MAKLRKAVAYRRIERPYTRKSKYKKKNYVRGNPVSKVVRYDMGDANKKYDYELNLIAKRELQIRHNSIESARLTSVRLLEKDLGKMGFHMKIRMFPHHVLRENPLASGAGADRMSTGMQKSFGKPIGIAAQVRKGKILITLLVNKSALETGKIALKRASYKIACPCAIEIVKLQ